jgi:hypothetical protein
MLQWLNVCKLLGGYSTVLKDTKRCAWCKAIHVPGWGLDQINMGSGCRRSRLRGSVEVEGPQPGAPILLLVVLAKCNSTERPPLGGEEKTAGQSAAAIATIAAEEDIATLDTPTLWSSSSCNSSPTQLPRHPRIQQTRRHCFGHNSRIRHRNGAFLDTLERGRRHCRFGSCPSSRRSVDHSV